MKTNMQPAKLAPAFVGGNVLLADGDLAKHREVWQIMTLNARQLHQAHELANPDAGDQDQEETEVTIGWRSAGKNIDGEDAPEGFYAWIAEYPEEGALFLDPDRPISVRSLSTAARDVLSERRRQISAEGWTPEHDDEHEGGSLAKAAACYALHTAGRDAWCTQSYQAASPPMDGPSDEDTLWPWDRESWKPKNQRADLVRAGALILAEIERLDRAASAIGPGCDAGGKA